MNKRFQTNVASEMPKTKAKEPELPWKRSREDIEEIGRQSEDRELLSRGLSPLKTRAVFLILLVLAIFTAAFYLITNIIIENENIRTNILRKEQEASVLKLNLEKMTLEKKNLSETSAQLEKKVSDLSAQKELFTSVIETLTKKGDEPEAKKTEDQAPDKKTQEFIPAASSVKVSAPSVKNR